MLEKNEFFQSDMYGKSTQRNLFEILSNKTEIRLYLPFSKSIEENGKYNLISDLFYKISKIFLRVCVLRTSVGPEIVLNFY